MTDSSSPNLSTTSSPNPQSATTTSSFTSASFPSSSQPQHPQSSSFPPQRERERFPTSQSTTSISSFLSTTGIDYPNQRSGSNNTSSSGTELSSRFPHLSHYLAAVLPSSPSHTNNIHNNSNSTLNVGTSSLELVGNDERKKSGSSSGGGGGGGSGHNQHPLSVSSFGSEDDLDGEGEGEDDSPEIGGMNDDGQRRKGKDADDQAEEQPTRIEDSSSSFLATSSSDRKSPPADENNRPSNNLQADKDALLAKLVDLLGDEREDEVRAVIKERLGSMGQDESVVDQICLDMMHKHKDDIDQVPFHPSTYLTPIKTRQTSSSSNNSTPTASSSSAYPARPFTPTRGPSFRARTPIGRPLSPAPGLGIIGTVGMTPTSSSQSLIGMGIMGQPSQQSSMFAFANNGAGTSGSAALGGGGVFGGGSPTRSVHSPLPGQSPMSSPRLLNAKAQLFSPVPIVAGQGMSGFGSPSSTSASGSVLIGVNVGSAAGGSSMTRSGSSGTLPPPSGVPPGMDPWQLARTASPGGSNALTRSSSNLAIATPLTMQQEGILGGDPYPSYHPHPAGERASSSSGSDEPGVDDIFSANTYHQHSHLIPDDDDDDEFSPFGSPMRNAASTSPATKLKLSARAFDPTRLGPGPPPAFGQMSPGNLSPGQMHSVPGSRSSSGSYFEPGGFGPIDDDYMSSGAMTPGGTPFQQPYNASDDPFASTGMTPLDVLQSVFTSLPQNELEEALVKANYEFEGAMAILIAQNGGTKPGGSTTLTPTRGASPAFGDRPLFPRSASGRDREYFHQGGRSGGFGGGGGGSGHISPRFGGGRTPGGHGGNSVGASRMCRYYLAGECRRADCRFSHDVDRALCRFWLRGQCAKGEQCEFIHNLPNLDPNILANAMARIELQEASRSRPHTPVDEFPSLDMGGNRQMRSNFDASRNRFANAVKRGPVHSRGMYGTPIGGSRFAAVGPRRDLSPNPGNSRAPPIPMPRPSHRIKLRPPTLLPTLSTGSSISDSYMEARSSAIKLGQARNACLARAADSWRRGDGAAAKRFSRDANVLNERMQTESAEAAAELVKQRRMAAQEAIRGRGDWSDDPGDRTVKGQECAGGLGVVMGIASVKALGPGAEQLSPDERTEVCLDLHALHANEGVDVLEDFLLALEKQQYIGLAYIIVGDERHTGTQDPNRGASKFRLAINIKQFLARWSYPWSEGGGIICVDPVRN